MEFKISGSRATSIFRFGFISLDLISIVLQDSGEYLCRVVSSTGVAESRATLSVTRESSYLNLSYLFNHASVLYLREIVGKLTREKFTLQHAQQSNKPANTPTASSTFNSSRITASIKGRRVWRRSLLSGRPSSDHSRI